MEGKTAWEVGTILGISERTAVLHLQNAMRKLESVNKHQAVLKAQHKALKAVILGLDPRIYGSRIAGSRHTVRRTVLGIAAHDIYHAGQISLLKRMAGNARRR